MPVCRQRTAKSFATDYCKSGMVSASKQELFCSSYDFKVVPQKSETKADDSRKPHTFYPVQGRYLGLWVIFFGRTPKCMIPSF